MFGLNNEQTRVALYGVMMVVIAFDWQAIGAGLFLVLMGIVTAPSKRPS